MAKNESDNMLRRALWRFSRIMYYRFEFARGCTNSIDWSPGHNEFAGAVDGEDDLPRISKRAFFLSSKGRPSYLDDLKADIKSVPNLKKKEINDNIKRFVEDTRSPPTNHVPATHAMYSNPFFPRFEEADPRLIGYCRQLLELDKYFREVIGVTPGAFLPVWPVDLPLSRWSAKETPQYASLVIGTSIVPALVSFIMQEHGDDNWPSCAKQLTRFRGEKVIAEAKNNPDILDDALFWGRIAHFIRVEVMEVGAFELSGDSKPLKFYPPKTLKETREVMDWYEEGFPDSFTGHIKRAMINADETISAYSGRFKNDDDEEIRVGDLANRASFRRKVLRHMVLGARLMDGEYKSLW